MSPVWLPAKTRAKLANPAAPGGRHHEMLDIALAWIGQGLSAEALFAELRAKHASDVTDREIHDVIRWAVARNPQPCGFAGPHSPVYGARRLPPPPTPISPESARTTGVKWLDGFCCDEADLWHVSPWRPLEDWRFDALMVLAGLYDKDERVNIVTEYEVARKADGSEKANPRGAGSLARGTNGCAGFETTAAFLRAKPGRGCGQIR